jgi:hypothetical protein
MMEVQKNRYTFAKFLTKIQVLTQLSHICHIDKEWIYATNTIIKAIVIEECLYT